MPTDVLDRVPAAADTAPHIATEIPTRRWGTGRRGRLLRRAVAAFALYLVVGNGLIYVATVVARFRTSAPTISGIDSINNFRVVDGLVWRGAAPGDEGLRDLAARGVSTIVDLRAEHDLAVDQVLIDDLGLERVHLPVRDGQLPTAEQAARFVEIVEQADGVVFVHCGAGVGRTGAIVAHYLTATGTADAETVLWHNLSVGPPSLEQIVFAAASDPGGYGRPGPIVTGMSRVLDAPRRIWHSLT